MYKDFRLAAYPADTGVSALRELRPVPLAPAGYHRAGSLDRLRESCEFIARTHQRQATEKLPCAWPSERRAAAYSVNCSRKALCSRQPERRWGSPSHNLSAAYWCGKSPPKVDPVNLQMATDWRVLLSGYGCDRSHVHSTSDPLRPGVRCAAEPLAADGSPVDARPLAVIGSRSSSSWLSRKCADICFGVVGRCSALRAQLPQPDDL